MDCDEDLTQHQDVLLLISAFEILLPLPVLPTLLTLAALANPALSSYILLRSSTELFLNPLFSTPGATNCCAEPVEPPEVLCTDSIEAILLSNPGDGVLAKVGGAGGAGLEMEVWREVVREEAAQVGLAKVMALSCFGGEGARAENER
jgi:hypothetical protein